jgi:hypothetical protein
MEELKLEQFYGQSLGLAALWRMAHVVIDGGRKEVRIRVDYTSGEA